MKWWEFIVFGFLIGAVLSVTTHLMTVHAPITMTCLDVNGRTYVMLDLHPIPTDNWHLCPKCSCSDVRGNK